MSTWHQVRNPVRCNPDKWTIVTDPPNGTRAHWECDTESRARARLAAWRSNGCGEHSYIVAPTAGAGVLL